MAPPKAENKPGPLVAFIFIGLVALAAIFTKSFFVLVIAVTLLLGAYSVPELRPMARKLIVVVVLLALLADSFVIIGAGQRGVLLTFGRVEDVVYGEGLHFKYPYAQDVAVFNVKTQKYEAVATAASKDLQDVKTNVALNYHVVSEKVNRLYQTIGADYRDIFIAPAIQESVKASTARFNAEELITERPTVKQRIEDQLKERLGERDIIVETVSITDFQFSPEFAHAIEQKQVAQQLALKAQRDLERIKIEADQLRTQAQGEADAKVTRATAEAEALRLQRDAISEQLLRLRAIEKWDGVLPKVISDAVPFIGADTLGVK